MLGISTGSWHYRRYGDPRKVANPIPQSQRCQPHQLTQAEVDKITGLLRQGWQAGLSTRTICQQSTDREEHLASPRTFERIAARIRTSQDRPRQRRKPRVKTPPVVVADRPNAAWSWDITDLPGPYVHVRYKVYMVNDIYSRKIVIHRVEERESHNSATQMFTTAFAEAKPGVLHADSGSAMIASSLKSLLAKHTVIESHSRPRVSNDNPYSESVFATMKTSPDYPGIFTSLEHARTWVDQWVAHYNADHLHSGVGFYPPNEIYNGTWTIRHQRRQNALAAHYAQHPNRYHHPPQAQTPKPLAGINLPTPNQLTKG